MDKNLEAFLIIAENGSVTEAARLMNLTQPTLTKRVQQLERHYGCPLFERESKGVRLTRSGEILYGQALNIRSSYSQALEAVRLSNLDEFPILRIGVGLFFQFWFLSDALSKLHREFPGTKLVLRGGVNSQNLPMLRDGDLDVVFASAEDLGFKDMFEFVPLFKVELGLVLPARHPLASGAFAEAHELSDLSWITYEGGRDFRSRVEGFFLQRGLTPPKIAVETSSFSMGRQLVTSGRYVMAAPIEFSALSTDKNLKIVRTNPPIGELQHGIFIRRSTVDAKILIRLVELIKSECGSSDDLSGSKA